MIVFVMCFRILSFLLIKIYTSFSTGNILAYELCNKLLVIFLFTFSFL